MQPRRLEAEGGARCSPLTRQACRRLKQIAADTDIGAFLQSGVPAELTRAALRRAWASDPAIRDFIGIAENQWDFNDPDAIPGFGPLPAADSAPAVLTQVLGKLDNIPEALSELPASVELDRPRVTDPEPRRPTKRVAPTSAYFGSSGPAT